MALSRQDGKSRPNKYSNSDKFLGRSPTYDNMEANLVISKLIKESSQESQRFRPCSATCSHVTLNKLFHLSHLRDTTICLHYLTEGQMRQHTHKSPVNCQVLHQWNVLCSNAPQFLQRFPKTYIILSLLCNRRNKFLVRNECPEIARVQALFCRETIIPQTKINECWKCSKARHQVLEKCKLTCRTLIFPTPKPSKKTPTLFTSIILKAFPNSCGYLKKKKKGKRANSTIRAIKINQNGSCQGLWSCSPFYPSPTPRTMPSLVCGQ